MDSIFNQNQNKFSFVYLFEIKLYISKGFVSPKMDLCCFCF